MKHEEPCKLLRIEEAAARLNVKPSTIRKMVLERRIDIVRPTIRAVRIPESWVNAAIEKGFQAAIK